MESSAVAETLVLGLGNILLGDEGLGVRVVERLVAQYAFPQSVRVMDGGTLGTALLPYLEDASRLLLVDAVHGHKPPGTLLRLQGDEILGFLDESRLSAHHENLHNLVTVALLKGYFPDEVVFWGVQVESVGVGLALSPAVAAQADVLVDKIVEELAQWRIHPRRRSG
jgi:hydrogenase maturation protease